MNHWRRKYVAVGMAFILLAAGVDLQARSPKGATVELISRNGDTVSGELLIVDPQGVTILAKELTTAISWDDLLHVRIKRTSRALPVLCGGIVLGVLAGWAIASGSQNDGDSSSSDFRRGLNMTAALSVGGLLGALTGGIAGYMLSKPKAFALSAWRIESPQGWKNNLMERLRPYSRKGRETTP